MKKMVLLGDSIRLGYDVLVREAYRDKAQVYFPRDNSCFAAFALRFLHEWKSEMNCGDDVDLVHWNVGAWDTLILYEDGPLTPIDVYQDYLDRLCRRIQVLFPKAKMIFATTTPMREELFLTPKIAMRYNKDIERYNEAAIAVVSRYGCVINDLYGLMKDKPDDYHSDVAHYYTKKGAEVLTRQVCSAIDSVLDLKAAEVNLDSWFAQTHCYDGMAWLSRRAQGIQEQQTILGT